MICPDGLRRRYRDGRVIPFVGAGASVSVEWVGSDGQAARGPSWGELVAKATELLGFADPELARIRGTDLQILEYFKQKNAGETAKLTRWLSKLMAPPDDALEASPIHSALARLTQCNLFYTTNYDDFIERAFRIHGRTNTVVAVEAEMGAEEDGCQIIKFHGDLDHPAQIVLTESDYESRLSLSDPMDYRLRSDLLGRVILFLGYSFRDPNVAYLFRIFTNQFWDQPGSLDGPRGYIAVPDPSDFEIQLFADRKIEVISIEGCRKTADTACLLDELRS